MRGLFNGDKPELTKIKEDGQQDLTLTRMIGYLTATSSENWAVVLDVCERASANEANAKEAAEALRREFKYGGFPQQLSAARLWAIMLRNSSALFVYQCAKNKFLDALDDVLTSQRTSPVVRERLLDVLAAAAFASSGAPPEIETGFRLLWRKVKPAGKPDEGVPFGYDDAMFGPPSPIDQRFNPLRENIPSQTVDILEEVGTPRYEEFVQALHDIPEDKHQYAVRLFQCLVAAIRPLSLKELADISAELDLNADPHEDAVLSACPSLITHRRDKDDITIVQFSHKSVKNFLTSSRLRFSCIENVSRYHFSLKAADATLAWVCINVLLRFDETTDNTRLKESSPSALYAAQYWVQHIQRGNAATENQGVMERLFDPSKSHLDAWIWMHDVDKGQSRTMEDLADRPSRRSATPLYYAALCGFTELVKHLASLRPEDLRDGHGYYGTPLHAASYMGHYDAALALLDRDPMMVDKKVDNKTPLHAAYYGGHLEIIKLLLDKGAEVDNILNNPYRRNDGLRSNAPAPLLGDDSHSAILGSSSSLDAIERPPSWREGLHDPSLLDSRIWARGSSSSLETIRPTTNYAVYASEYPSSISLPSNGDRCSMSFMTSPSDGSSVTTGTEGAQGVPSFAELVPRHVAPLKLKGVIRTHHGAVSQATVTTGLPSDVMRHLRDVLESMGVDVQVDSDYKYRCVRAKRRRAPAAPSGIVPGMREPLATSTLIGSATSNGVDKRGLPLASQSSFGVATGGMLKGLLMRSFQPGEMVRETVYGDPTQDPGVEVRFYVQLTKLDGLKDTYSIDIRRLKGHLRSYKFLYDWITERLDLQQ